LRLTTGLLVLAFAGLTTPLHAEGYLSPFVGAAFSGSTNGTRLTYGGSLTIAAHDSVLGFAIDFSRTPDFFGDTALGDNSVTVLMGDLVLITPGSVRIYASGGAGLMKTRVRDATGFFDVDSNDWGWNAGGGLLVFPGGAVGLYGDIRYFKNITDPFVDVHDIDFGGLSFWRGTGGISFRF
jgi:hypothetical protein